MTFERYREIFRIASFRRFWLGFTFSVLGDGMTRVALIWYVFAATGSSRAVGWLRLCYTGPIVVGGLMAGVLLDRFDRRRVMIADNLTRGVAIAAIPILHAFDRLDIWHVYTVAGVYGLLMMLSLAGGPSLVPSLVPDAQLPTANALEMLSFTVGGVIGPPLAGLLISSIAAPDVLVIDAVSYGLFAFALARIPRIPPPQVESPEEEPRRLSDAVKLLLRSPILLSTTAMFLTFNIGGGLLSVWLPSFSSEKVGGGSTLYGVLLGFIALGEVIASLLAGAVELPVPLGALICLAQTLSGIALLIMLVSESVWTAAVGLALYGAFSAPLTIWAQTLRMRIIPERLRGRSFALLRTLMQSGRPIGGAVGGLALSAIGIPLMIVASAIVVGAPGLAGLAIPGAQARRQRRAIQLLRRNDRSSR